MSQIVVSLHDVAPATAELSRRWLDLLETLGVRASLLVIPGRWNGKELFKSPAFVDWLHAAESRGHEIVQHGLLHTRDKNFATASRRSQVGQLLGRGCQEFWELPYEEAFKRLIQGKSIMAKCGFQATGFVAPAWMMSEATLDALRDSGFQYTNNHTHLINTQTGAKACRGYIAAPAQPLKSSWCGSYQWHRQICRDTRETTTNSNSPSRLDVSSFARGELKAHHAVSFAGL